MKSKPLALVTIVLVISVLFFGKNVQGETNDFYFVDVLRVQSDVKIIHVPYLNKNVSIDDVKITEGGCGILSFQVTVGNESTLEIALPHDLEKIISNFNPPTISFILIDKVEKPFDVIMTDSANTYFLDIPSDAKEIEFLGDCLGTFRHQTMTPKGWYETGIYIVNVDENKFDIGLFSNSTSYEPFFMKNAKRIGVIVTGDAATSGSLEIQIPHTLLDGQIQAFIDKKSSNAIVQKNNTHSTINVNYIHDTSPSVIEIIGTTVVPEFHMPIMMIGTISIISMLIITKIFVLPAK